MKQIQKKTDQVSQLHLKYQEQPFSQPLRRASASITASTGGGSTAFIMNCPIGPSRNSFIDKHNSWRGVRNISGVVCCSSLKKKYKQFAFFWSPIELYNTGHNTGYYAFMSN